MSCRCISYNRPDLNPLADQPEVILPRPAWSSRERGICVDACIADAIKMLWAHDVITSGCCCGHNWAKPSVIVDLADHALLAIKLLKENDGRDWDVMQWRLCIVHQDNSAHAVPSFTFAPAPASAPENGEPTTARKRAPLSPVRSRPAAAGKREPRGPASVGLQSATQRTKKPGNFSTP